MIGKKVEKTEADGENLKQKYKIKNKKIIFINFFKKKNKKKKKKKKFKKKKKKKKKIKSLYLI